MSYIINLPFSIPVNVPRKMDVHTFTLNLNKYRNAHYLVLSSAKKNFYLMMFPQVAKLPVMNTISITYTVYPKSKILLDIANVCSIVDKFFQDSLVKQKKIKDDNYLFVKKVSFQFGEVDKENARIEAEITELI